MHCSEIVVYEIRNQAKRWINLILCVDRDLHTNGTEAICNHVELPSISCSLTDVKQRLLDTKSNAVLFQ